MTVFADSSHIELATIASECCTDNVSSILEVGDQQDSNEHCPNHDCCHQNHIHHYLLLKNFLILDLASTDRLFPRYLANFTSNFSEIVKPPIV
ncbi:MAG: hypothetical protein JNM93_10850 [Bacteriovoracaceae bacterium]|nr:hypothetical protein [Bacteriovoracaceae bacterium]